MIYFISTPIGNLEDISFRAIKILKEVDIIFCEDTRVSLKLLSKYNINKKLQSFHKYNEYKLCEYIEDLNNKNKNIAIISDAGTPIISDPGNILTKFLHEKNIKYTLIPGACALISALVLSGFDSSKFLFAGFIPEKNTERKKVLTDLSTVNTTIIFYVSPHNIDKDIIDIYKYFGNRKACLVKEISKIHESVFFFNLKDGLNLDNVKGEFVLLISKDDDNHNELNNISVADHLLFYINLGFSKNDAIKKVAKDRKVNKNEIYKQVLHL